MPADHGVADTSVFIVREAGRALDVTAVPERLTVSVITVGELRAGFHAAIDPETRDARLETLLWAMQVVTRDADYDDVPGLDVIRV